MKRILNAIIVATALLSTSAIALSTGKIEVLSGVNQPFFAKITLYNIGFLDKDSLKVELAEQREFDRLKTERKHVLTQLKFKPIFNGEHSFIEVRGRRPVKETYIDFIVDIKWPKGRIIRPYTALIPIPTIK